MHSKTGISIQFNGAEYLELLACASKAGMSVPAYVLTQCGIETWRQDAARERAAPAPRGFPVRSALERRSVMLRVTEPARAELLSQAFAAGTTLAQYIRTRCGLHVRNTSLPGTAERDVEEDDAWERLKGLGLDPRVYFPPAV